METAVKYAIADDHKIFRQGLKYALADDSLMLMGEAENGVELLDIVENNKPDVVLLDIVMPVMDGIETTRQLRTKYPDLKILMLTTYNEEHLIISLLEHGANGYLLKNADPDEIKRAIHYVLHHDYYFNDLASNTMLKTITQKSAKEKERPEEPLILSDREKEVLRFICEELTTQEIGKRIFLSPRTVEGIRSGMLEKIKVKNTAGLVLYAVKHGIYNIASANI